MQQLGRGLRLSEGKEALTVLGFVGQAHKKYSFEERFKALLSRTRKTVEHEIKHGFANVLSVAPQDVYSKKVTVVGLAGEADLIKGSRVEPEKERLLASALGRLSFINSRR